MLSLERLAAEPIIEDPYPHLALPGALEHTDSLNDDFPLKDRFGPTIRMDGDLTAGDPGYEKLIVRSSYYKALHKQIYSIEFVKACLEPFRQSIRAAYQSGQLLVDPFKLPIVPAPVEMRVGRSFVSGTELFLYPRVDIGYGVVGYGKNSGGRGIHIDNLPRLISIMVFLIRPSFNEGRSFIASMGFMRANLYLKKIYRPIAGLLVASLQSNRAFHDVDPIVSIDGERRAFYIAISCSGPIWKKETNKDLSALKKNRDDPPPIGNSTQVAAPSTGRVDWISEKANLECVRPPARIRRDRKNSLGGSSRQLEFIARRPVTQPCRGLPGPLKFQPTERTPRKPWRRAFRQRIVLDHHVEDRLLPSRQGPEMNNEIAAPEA